MILRGIISGILWDIKIIFENYVNYWPIEWYLRVYIERTMFLFKGK